MKSKYSLEDINKEQKAVLGPAGKVRRTLHGLIPNVNWTVSGDSQSGRFLQHTANNEEEAQQLLNQIKTIFDGFDLGIEWSKNEGGGVSLNIPTYIVKQIGEKKINPLPISQPQEPTTLQSITPASINNNGYVRDDLSKLLANNELDIVLIGECHNDSTARFSLIDNIDLIAEVNSHRSVSVLMEHLPYKEGSYFSKADKKYKNFDVIEEVSSCIKNGIISKDLKGLIEQNTALYMNGIPKNEYLSLAECCINNGINFSGAENIETKNTSLFGGNCLDRVITGDQAFVSSVTSTHQLVNRSHDKKPLMILLCGQAHLPGVKQQLQEKGLNVYSWAIQSKMDNENVSRQNSVKFDQITTNHQLKEFFSRQYPTVTIDLQSNIDLKQESKYSADAVQLKNSSKNLIAASNFKEKLGQLKSDDEPKNEEGNSPPSHQ